MIILGKTNDDKGMQLEQLTKNILERRGYKRIITNFIGAGGEEIDLTAEYEVPQINNNFLIKKILCECKAHKKPNDINDWLKFLGKVYHSQIINKEIIGCFISLSGVNGNVAGNYEDIKKSCPSIQMINGDDLLQAITEIYNLHKFDSIRDIVKKFVNYKIEKHDIIYYKSKNAA